MKLYMRFLDFCFSMAVRDVRGARLRRNPRFPFHTKNRSDIATLPIL